MKLGVPLVNVAFSSILCFASCQMQGKVFSWRTGWLCFFIVPRRTSVFGDDAAEVQRSCRAERRLRGRVVRVRLHPLGHGRHRRPPSHGRTSQQGITKLFFLINTSFRGLRSVYRLLLILPFYQYGVQLKGF